MRRLLRALHREDAGMTLAELMVGMLLTSMIATAAVSFLVASRKQVGFHTRVSESAIQANRAADWLSRDLRMAIAPQTGVQAFQAAGPRSATFYSNVNSGPAPWKVTYRVQSGNLIRETTPPSGTTAPYTWPASGTTSRTVARGLDTAQPLFRWLNAAEVLKAGVCGESTSPCATPLPLTSGALTSANRDLVAGVDSLIRVATGSPGQGRTPTVQQIRIVMPNAGTTAVIR